MFWPTCETFFSFLMCKSLVLSDLITNKKMIYGSISIRIPSKITYWIQNIKSAAVPHLKLKSLGKSLALRTHFYGSCLGALHEMRWSDEFLCHLAVWGPIFISHPFQYVHARRLGNNVFTHLHDFSFSLTCLTSLSHVSCLSQPSIWNLSSFSLKSSNLSSMKVSQSRFSYPFFHSCVFPSVCDQIFRLSPFSCFFSSSLLLGKPQQFSSSSSPSLYISLPPSFDSQSKFISPLPIYVLFKSTSMASKKPNPHIKIRIWRYAGDGLQSRLWGADRRALQQIQPVDR